MKKLLEIYKSSFSGLDRYIWLLSFVMLVNRAGSMVLLFLSLYLTKELHFSLSQAGVVLGFYGAGSIVGSYVGGWLTDRFDYYKIMVYSLVISGLILLGLIFVKTYYGIICIVFLYSLFADTFRPANSVAIGKFSDDSNKTRSFSLMRMAINLGFTIGPAVGGFVALYVGYGYLFLIDSLTSIGAAVLILVYLPKRKSESDEQKKLTTPLDGLSAYKDKLYMTFIALVGFFAICFFQLFTSIPLFFSKGLHLSEDTIGLLLAYNGALIVVIEMPMVHYLEKGGKVIAHIAVGSFLMVLSFLFILPNTGNLIWPLIFMTMITLSEVFAMPFMSNFAISRASPGRQGQYMALYAIAYGGAHIIAPMLGLRLADALGFILMFVIIASLSLLVGFGFLMLKKLHPDVS